MTLIILIAIACLIVIGFMLWCCLAIAKRADEQTDRLYRDHRRGR